MLYTGLSFKFIKIYTKKKYNGMILKTDITSSICNRKKDDLDEGYNVYIKKKPYTSNLKSERY